MLNALQGVVINSKQGHSLYPDVPSAHLFATSTPKMMLSGSRDSELLTNAGSNGICGHCCKFRRVADVLHLTLKLHQSHGMQNQACSIVPMCFLAICFAIAIILRVALLFLHHLLLGPCVLYF